MKKAMSLIIVLGAIGISFGLSRSAGADAALDREKDPQSCCITVLPDRS